MSDGNLSSPPHYRRHLWRAKSAIVVRRLPAARSAPDPGRRPHGAPGDRLQRLHPPHGASHHGFAWHLGQTIRIAVPAWTTPAAACRSPWMPSRRLPSPWGSERSRGRAPGLRVGSGSVVPLRLVAAAIRDRHRAGGERGRPAPRAGALRLHETVRGCRLGGVLAGCRCGHRRRPHPGASAALGDHDHDHDPRRRRSRRFTQVRAGSRV